MVKLGGGLFWILRFTALFPFMPIEKTQTVESVSLWN